MEICILEKENDSGTINAYIKMLSDQKKQTASFLHLKLSKIHIGTFPRSSFSKTTSVMVEPSSMCGFCSGSIQ